MTADAQRVEELRRLRRQHRGEPEPDLNDQGAHERQRYPVEAFPRCVGELIQAEARATQTPPEIGGGLALAVLATAMQGRFDVMVRDGYREPLCLNTVTSSPPATRKSSVFGGSLFKPLIQYETEENKRRAEAIRAADRRVKHLEALSKRANKALYSMDPGHEDYEQANMQADRAAAELDVALREKPTRLQLFTADTTTERAAGIANEQGGRVSVFTAEGGEYFALLRRYSRGGAANLEFWLKAHAGDAVRVDRANVDAPQIAINRAVASIGLALQPGALREALSDAALKERGLLARFLIAEPRVMLGSRTFLAPPVPESVKERYASVISWLFELQTPDDAGATIELEADARGELEAFFDWIEPQLAPGGAYEPIRDWAGKCVGAAARIAGLFHAVQCAEHGVYPTAERISADTMKRGISVARFYLSEAQRLFAEVGQSEETKRETKAMRSIKKNWGEGADFSSSDLWDKVKGGVFREKQELDAAIDALLVQGLLVKIEAPIIDGASGRPGGPRFAIRVTEGGFSGYSGYSGYPIQAFRNESGTRR